MKLESDPNWAQLADEDEAHDAAEFVGDAGDVGGHHPVTTVQTDVQAMRAASDRHRCFPESFRRSDEGNGQPTREIRHDLDAL